MWDLPSQLPIPYFDQSRGTHPAAVQETTMLERPTLLDPHVKPKRVISDKNPGILFCCLPQEPIEYRRRGDVHNFLWAVMRIQFWVCIVVSYGAL
jgi:hypothetical protein